MDCEGAQSREAGSSSRRSEQQLSSMVAALALDTVECSNPRPRPTTSFVQHHMLVDSMPREYRHLQTLAHCACCNAGLDSIFHDYAFLTVSRREQVQVVSDFSKTWAG